MQIKQKFNSLHCVGYVNGTHLGLALKPELHGEEYWTCKQQYTISALVFIDGFRRIRNLQVGWPGSVHDNRIWKNSMVCLQKEQYFSAKQYLLRDSAFNNSTVMVSSYKKTAGSVCLPAGQ